MTEPQSTPPPTPTWKSILYSTQFFWAVGHFITLIFSILYLLTRSNPSFYYKAYYGTLLSYALIWYRTHGLPSSFDTSYIQKLLLDENTQYCLLALIWVTSKPFSVTLIPFTTFSLFHSIFYLKSILPQVSQSEWIRSLSVKMGGFATKYQQQGVFFAAAWEVWILMPLTIIGIFFGYTSFFAPIIVFQFLRFRAMLSPVTKSVLRDARLKLDLYSADPRVPVWAKNGYEKCRDLIIKYGDLRTAAQRD